MRIKVKLKTKTERKKEMRGIGGPLLTIGDLLSDVGEENFGASDNTHLSIQESNNIPHSFDLTRLFQENYGQLNEAFAGSEHSWTALTLKLCTALETANKLVQSANTNVTLLSEKVVELEKVVEREDSAIAAAKAINASLNQKKGPTLGS